MTRLEIEQLLSNMMSYERKDFKYELLLEEDEDRGTMTLSIVKYNYIDCMKYINYIINNDEEKRLRFLHNRSKEESVIKRINSFICRSIIITKLEYRKFPNETLTQLLISFLGDLGELAHRQVELISVNKEATHEVR